MKISKFILAGSLALALAGTVSAATPVLHITGAGTYRPATQKAIEDILNTGYTFGYTGSSHYKPNASIYYGTLKSNSQPIIIETYWAGDLSGAVTTGLRTSISSWIKTDAATLATLTASGVVLSSTYQAESAIPDLASTVSYYTSSAATIATQGATGRTDANILLNAHFKDAGSAGLAGGAGAVGIAPFEWVIGRLANGYTAPFTNITQQQANALITNGYLPIAAFTGSSSQLYQYAILVGRSEDAGARTVPFAEAQNGFGNPPQQYQLTFSGSNLTTQADGLVTGGTNATVTGLYLWPANAPLNQLPSLNWSLYGHSGYNITSDLSNALSAVNPVAAASLAFGNGSDANDPTAAPTGITHAYFVGYNGIADASSLITAGGTALSYNGVPYSVAAVQNGQYTLWSYAHYYYIGSGANQLSGVPKQAADDLADKVYTTDADINSSGAHSSTTGVGIFLNASVLVSRPGVEGTPVFQNY